jgi:hypothetical protein
VSSNLPFQVVGCCTHGTGIASKPKHSICASRTALAGFEGKDCFQRHLSEPCAQVDPDRTVDHNQSVRDGSEKQILTVKCIAAPENDHVQPCNLAPRNKKVNITVK